MTLIEFHSDKGQGYQYSSVFINPEDVSVVDGIAVSYGHTRNRTVISLKNGDKIYVHDNQREAAKRLTQGDTQ